MKRDVKHAFVFLLPAALVTIGLVIYPIIKTFMYSLQRYKLTEPENVSFIGWENYIKVLKNEGFQEALINTLIVMVEYWLLAFYLVWLLRLFLIVKRG